MKSLKFGLKVWSTNKNYLDSIKELKSQGFIDYIELFVEQGSMGEHVRIWKDLDMPFILHAPHSYAGLNFSDRGSEQQNRLLLHKVKLFADELHAEKIIFHPGLKGTVDETIRQIQNFKKDFPDVFEKAVIENKPKLGLGNEVCVGATCDEISRIMKETVCGFCFDIAHALCYTFWAKRNWEEVTAQFLALNPDMYHLSDGDINTPYDKHCHFGEGSYPLDKIIKMLPDDIYLSIETPKDAKDNLDDYKKDVEFVRKYRQTNDIKTKAESSYAA